MRKEIIKAIVTLIYLLIGIVLIWFWVNPKSINTVFIALVGLTFIAEATPNTFYFIKEYGGKKVWRKLFKK